MGVHTSLLAIVFMVLASSMSCLMSYSLHSEYSILEHDIDAFLSEERVVEIFHQWKQNHGKVYKNDEEATKRLENFKRNLKYIFERNNDAKRKHSNGLHRVGLNKFADMSNEEFRQYYLSKVKMPIKKRSILSERNVQSCDAPSSFDWRNYGVVTAVKNQKSCGSCWAFSTTGAIEAINAIVTGNLISLSEQELVDCDSTNYGCRGGFRDRAFEWVINNGGIDSEANYPYTAMDGTCNITEEENKVVSIDGYVHVEDSDGELLCAVVQQPISVGIDSSSIDFQLYTGGIFDNCSSEAKINHAVLIVGYGAEDDEKYWIVKNSWGTDWGMEGYFYLKRDAELPNGVCAVNARAYYPTKQSSSPSPIKNARDYLGVAAKKRKMAKHKFPWTKKVEEIETEKTLQWKRNPVDAMR